MKKRAPPDQYWASLNESIDKIESVRVLKLFIAKKVPTKSQ